MSVLCLKRFPHLISLREGEKMKKHIVRSLLILIALAVGAVIGWIDTGPQWDDTGITVVMIFGSSALFGLFSPKVPWLWGVLIGSGIPAWNIVRTGNYQSLVSLAVAVIGAYSGAIIRNVFLPPDKPL